MFMRWSVLTGEISGAIVYEEETRDRQHRRPLIVDQYHSSVCAISWPRDRKGLNMGKNIVGTDVNQIQISSLSHIHGQPQVIDTLQLSLRTLNY